MARLSVTESRPRFSNTSLVSSRRENAGKKVNDNLIRGGDTVSVGPMTGNWDSVINTNHVLINLAIIRLSEGFGFSWILE